ncbi:siderophore ABC transporter substrate-binding protein [Nisaea nitritireducens]|uniref:siderophore ABC transporter substrate-binding protein n=1 Tax=Nisaea nitritireducens TaxID=568392 RepID=UPI001D023CD8|nr:siderophore ABC transporter substrate-binding protein [Nisaea nitritireducens]
MFSTMRRSALACATILAVTIGVSTAFAQEVVVEHAKGTTTLPAIPEKVLVFNLSALDVLDAIGVEVTGVPGGPKPEHLAKYASGSYLNVGSLFEPDYEAVVAAEPDLVIVGGRSSRNYDDLSKIAPTIDLSAGWDNHIEDAKRNALTLGKVFGKEAEVRALVDKLESSTAELQALAGKAGTALAMITTGGKMSAHGPGSRFSVLYDVYGFKPAVEDLGTGLHGQPISFEFLLETDPDWLFVVDRDAAIGREAQSAAAMLDNEIIHKTKAWKAGHIVYVNAGNWYLAGTGLQALQMNVDEIAGALKAK